MIVIETFGRGRTPGASREHGRREKYDPMPPEKSLRDVKDLLAERGIAVSYEAIRRWVNHFGPKCTRRSNNPSLKRPGIPVAQPE
jgi:hypothetical protein